VESIPDENDQSKVREGKEGVHLQMNGLFRFVFPGK
jgi:hypothetical protein